VALEGELARRFRAWGSWDSIGEDTPLGQALLEVRKVLGPFWLRVMGRSLYLAFPGSGLAHEPPPLPRSGPRAVGGEASRGRWGPSRGCSGPWRRAVRSVLPRTAPFLGKTAGRPPRTQAEGERGLTQERPSPLFWVRRREAAGSPHPVLPRFLASRFLGKTAGERPTPRVPTIGA
jgi:hypothetical protein